MSQGPTKKINKKWTIAHLGMVAFTLALATGCTAPTGDDGADPVAPPTASPSGAAETTVAPVPGATYAVGETVTMGDLEHTLHGVRFAQGDEFSTPEPGTRWLVADIEVTNNSDASVPISSAMMWTLNDPDNRSSNTTFAGDERGALDGELGPGRSMRGEIAYEVNAEHSNWELLFSPDVMGLGQAIYEIPAPEPAGDAPTVDPAAHEPSQLPMPGAIPNQSFTYEEALTASENGMPYYDAFCIHYEPTTEGGRSQCEGIEAGTVDSITGEYIGG